MLTTLFLAILSVYFAIAIFCFAETRTPHGFFDISSRAKMRITAVFGGITLGTGFAYFSTAGSTLGFGAIAGPLGVLLGYSALAAVEKRISNASSRAENDFTYRNFSAFFSQDSRFSALTKLYNVVRLFVYIGLIAFEIWLSSTYISSIFGFPNGGDLLYVTAVLLGVMAIGYAVIGGYPAAVKTDYFQALMVISLIIYLLVAGASIVSNHNNEASVVEVLTAATPNFDLHWIVGSSAVLVTAIATQFYNVINTSASRSRPSRENISNFRVVGLCQATIIGLIVVIGVLFPEVSDGGSLKSFLANQSSGNTMSDAFIAAFILISLTAIIFTTVDSAIVSLAQLLGDIFNKDLDSKEERIWPRAYAGGIGLIAMPIALWFIYKDLPLMDVIFAILTPLGALAAYLVAAVYYSLRYRKQRSNPIIDWAVLVVIIVISASQIVNIFNLSEGMVALYTLTAFVPAVLMFLAALPYSKAWATLRKRKNN